jgi:hypothetical protein
MKLKTAYRNKSQTQYPADKGPAPSEKIDINSEPAADAVVVRHESDGPPSEAVTEGLAKATDEATLRLQKQLSDLQRSEHLQRNAQMAAMQPQRPMSRGQLIGEWRKAGMTEADEQFLTDHPAMIDHHQITAIAAHQAAQQGHERGTDAHREATRQNFDEHLARLQAQALPPPEPPQFFKPPPPPEPPSAASYVSAPVSRGEVGGYREPSPSSVRLTPDEIAIAKASGISPVEYAKNKLTMLRKQRTGEIQN